MPKRINDYRCPACGNVSEHFWDVDAETFPVCPACSTTTERMLAAPRISYEGAKTFRQRVPGGFKDVLKQIDKTTPDHYKAGKISAL
jgi:putative FmdB family regulatory protein